MTKEVPTPEVAKTDSLDKPMQEPELARLQRENGTMKNQIEYLASALGSIQNVLNMASKVKF